MRLGHVRYQEQLTQQQGNRINLHSERYQKEGSPTHSVKLLQTNITSTNILSTNETYFAPTTTIHYHPLPSITIHYHPLPSITIHYHPLPSITIHYHPFISITMHYHPLPSIPYPIVIQVAHNRFGLQALHLEEVFVASKSSTKGVQTINRSCDMLQMCSLVGHRNRELLSASAKLTPWSGDFFSEAEQTKSKIHSLQTSKYLARQTIRTIAPNLQTVSPPVNQHVGL